MARNNKIDKTMPKPRNPMAMIARKMRAASFDHKNTPRGGANNEMADLMADYFDDSQDDDCQD